MLHIRSIGIRFKLITIFILIKVLPLMLLAWVAWNGITVLGDNVEDRVAQLSTDAQETISNISTMAVDSSIRALDLKSREAIERLTTDTARAVGSFLYTIDNNILHAAVIDPSAASYKQFLATNSGYITKHAPWVLNHAGDSWVPKKSSNTKEGTVTSQNLDNAKDFHSRPSDEYGIRAKIPLFLEMTFVDLNGNELIKITTSDVLPAQKKNISIKSNTYCKAENYFPELKKLSPGEIYVSEVIGPYLKSPIIGSYTKERAEKKGIAFDPENAAYAGKENPVGKRFQGLVRWATPVVQNGKITGYVTLALDHTHLMEFTDHIVPTAERYTAVSDASTGNYAFMWDYKDRNISHPRDYFIVGYDPETGEPAIPWLSANMYENFQQSDSSVSKWEKTAPEFLEQSLKKKPAVKLTDAGLLGLDCRYLNFAPQCDGWHNLTQNGGSGSFVIWWSGLWKLTTAASIPYHTGIYSGKRGFGFITIGANVHEFHKAATDTGENLENIAADFQSSLKNQNDETQQHLQLSQAKTSKEIGLSTMVMVIAVVLVAIWMASTLTKKITDMIKGIREFQDGKLDYRLKIDSSDEVGQLGNAFNDMSNDIQTLITDLRQAEEKYRGFFENATEGIYRSTIDGKLVNVNPAFAKLMGYDSSEEMLSKVKEIGSQIYVDPQRRIELLSILKRDGSVRDFEYEARLSSGGSCFLATYCRLVTQEDGQVYLEGMTTNVSERKLKEKAEIEKEAAIKANKSKSEFLANMSHEIRTPMNAILGTTEMLAESGLTPLQSKYVSLFKSSGESLLQLINEILDFSKIEAGQMTIHNEVFCITELLDKVISIMAIQAKKDGLEFESFIYANIPKWVKGDQLRLKQVLMNLLGNAIKFTNKGTIWMDVSVESRDAQKAMLTFKIKDSGIGIEQDKIAKIFNSFTQADSSTTRKYGGTGLGLAISKRLVDLMGGNIKVSSEQQVGTSFSATIPFLIAQAETEKEISPADSPDSSIADSQPKKVLIVEDNESNQILLEHYLKETKHRIIMAENGQVGVDEYMNNGDIDIILMDIQMPIMDGITATKKIRAYERDNDLPPVQIVALTANAYEDDRKNCLDSGCDYYLSKPVSKANLISLLGEGKG